MSIRVLHNDIHIMVWWTQLHRKYQKGLPRKPNDNNDNNNNSENVLFIPFSCNEICVKLVDERANSKKWYLKSNISDYDTKTTQPKKKKERRT